MIIVRELYSKIKPFLNVPEAIIITGMRRVGKTTLLHFIMDKIESKNKIFIDLENPANQKYFEENDYERVLNNFEVLGLNIHEKGYVFLDEIQFSRNIPSVVKYLFDHYGIKFFLSGSASFYLKNVFSESLSGRKYIFELFPLSFKEFVRIKELKINIDLPKEKITLANFDLIERYYDEYVLYGGFPGVVSKKTIQEKKGMLEDIFSSYYQLEVVQLGDFKKTGKVRDLMLLLMERTGSKLDIQKLARELEISRETVSNYMAFLESTYFIKLVRPFTRNKDAEIRKMPKFYLCDSGIINQFAKVSEGALFENNVFWALQREGKVSYYQKKNGSEIDFILNKNLSFEVKTKVFKQDLDKLEKISRELKIKDYNIISKKYSDLKHVIYGFML